LTGGPDIIALAPAPAPAPSPSCVIERRRMVLDGFALKTEPDAQLSGT
jgi:hypothetical protein